MITLNITLTNEQAAALVAAFNEQRSRFAVETGRESLTPAREDELTKQLAAIDPIYAPLWHHLTECRRLDDLDYLQRLQKAQLRTRRGEQEKRAS
jgi:hypothetical protein